MRVVGVVATIGFLAFVAWGFKYAWHQARAEVTGEVGTVRCPCGCGADVPVNLKQDTVCPCGCEFVLKQGLFYRE